ncbi:bifunctional Clathrin-coatomer adaptor [Babesia duncani]|uniref:Bifunctional Clathrin-coatomer adaptor n=1 Tax=Babesia duncani TaxID=323732 RepID=A0AAD9UM92_9APIC|nr:bifunctional Clathrin-coatomer adaptor [Babesia duncani]KAK2196565.1 bifunctional Clathrin-coatomer adaptor [Babesia duncani]
MEGKYFKGNRQSELQQLREELLTSSKDRKKDAIKKIIGAMTTGKDVSSLFPDVVNCIQTDNIELKKLVYLYVINYAKVQPELAILAVNTFCKDARDRNPLIRSLAIRTMGYIRLSAITEYLVEPLKRSQNDSDPYVRKTAAICIGKLYAISPSLVHSEGFLDMLEHMLSDENPTVVANAAATLVEISEQSDEDIFGKIINKDSTCLGALTRALNFATEWGQVYILDALTMYNPANASDAKKLIEAILPRFAHINPAVVVSAMKVVLNCIDLLEADYARQVLQKLAAPLVTLTSLEPEIQYVALVSIQVILSKWPKLLEDHVSSFYCKYKDPFYVKVEKLKIIIRLATPANYTKILAELREYTNDIDVDFVRQNVRAIGQMAIRLEPALSACLALIEELLNLNITHLTEECTVVFMEILRAYPRTFKSELFYACADAEYLHAPESKAALIWILGQHASEIPDAAEYLQNLAESFECENFQVQSSLITAATKVHLAYPEAGLLEILQTYGATNANPDIRDRTLMYLRLLERGPAITAKIVSAPLPKIAEHAMDLQFINDMLRHLGQVSAIYQLPSWAIESSNAKLLDSSQGHMQKQQEIYSDDDEKNDDMDLFGSNVFKYECKQEIVIDERQKGSKGQTGLQVMALLYRQENDIFLRMTIYNKTAAKVMIQALQFNVNPFGLTPLEQLVPVQIDPDHNREIVMQLAPNKLASNKPPDSRLVIQAAIKTSIDIFYFGLEYQLPLVLTYNARMEPERFINMWRDIKNQNTTRVDELDFGRLMKRMGMFFVGNLRLNSESSTWRCFCANTTNSLVLLAAFDGQDMVIKSDASALIPLVTDLLAEY